MAPALSGPTLDRAAFAARIGGSAALPLGAYGSAGIASGGRDCPLRPADLFVCDIRRCRLRP